MNRLHELQCRFREALLYEDARSLHETQLLVENHPINARLGIYRNNVFTNLREALRTFYPVVNRLVGDACFNYCAEEYIRRYPSPAGDLNQFGEHYALFLSCFETVATLHYLPDVARLEWLAHRAYHASLHAPLDLTRLAQVNPADYGKLQFSLHPACALFASEYPVHTIWQVNQPGFKGDESVDLRTGGARVLIARRASLIELQPLSSGTWALLSALAENKNFATASAMALQVEPKLDLSTTLSNFVSQATLVDFVLDNEPAST